MSTALPEVQEWQLPGHLLQLLHTEMGKRFSVEELLQFVQFHFNQSLQTICATGTSQDPYFAVLEWVERRGRWGEFLQTVWEEGSARDELVWACEQGLAVLRIATPSQYVLLSHGSADTAAVGQVAAELRQRGLKVLPHPAKPGAEGAWRQTLKGFLERSRAAVLGIGAQGLQPWTAPPLKDLLEQHVRAGRPVFLLLLATAPEGFEPPPFVRSNTVIRLTQSDVWDRLEWALTGLNPALTPPPAPAAGPGDERLTERAVEEALDNLAALGTDNITYFLGTGMGDGTEGAQPSNTWEITRSLLLDLKVIEQTYHGPLPPVHTAGAYYAVKKREALLEEGVASLIKLRSRAVPPTHRLLGRLLGRAARRPRQRRRPQTKQLVISTSLDLLMERALLLAGVPFTRIVQHGSDPRVTVSHYRDVLRLDDQTVRLRPEGGDWEDVRPDELARLDELVEGWEQRPVDYGPAEYASARPASLSLQDTQGLILYKFCGSVDVPGSCTISAPRYFEFGREILRPNPVAELIGSIGSNTPVVFLGCGFLDLDFRLAYHALIKRPLRGKIFQRYAIQLRPAPHEADIYRQIEEKIWDDLKADRLEDMHIRTLEIGPDVFLQRLLDRS